MPIREPGSGSHRAAVALLVAVFSGAVALAAVLSPSKGGEGTGTSASVRREAGSSHQSAPGFSGSEACRACHEEQYGAWAASTHGTAGGPATPETVIAPFEGPPIRFADAVVRPVTDPEGRYVFVVERPARPPLRYVVSGVIGRGHMVGGGTQGFISRFADGTERFLPFDYSAEGDLWFCNTAFVAGFWVPGADRARLRADAGWQPITNEMRLAECGDWPPTRILGTNRRFANCQNCHGSQIDVEYLPEMGRYNTRLATLRINCESCHGPGQDHVEKARSGSLAASSVLGLPVLDTLDTDASLQVCFQCHALKRALADPPAGTAEDYSLGLPVIGDSPYLPDGRVRTFGYQQTHRSSACYLSGSMTCTDCHDPHSQGYRDPFGAPLNGRYDDGQCTACHASKAADPQAHTFHPPGSAGARCVSCHMPYLQHPELTDAVPYARSDHTIPIPRPGFDEGVGLESACAMCHRERSPMELARQVSEWWGEIKPYRPSVTALVAATAPGTGDAQRDGALAAAAALGNRYGLTKLMAIDAWVRGQARLDNSSPDLGDPDPFVPDPPGAPGPTPGLNDAPGRSLALLGEDDDEDVRAVAAAALHVVRGGNPDVRSLLDGWLRGAPDPAGFRARWAEALSQWAAVAARVRGPDAALIFLQRAAEVRPASPEALVGLASGLAATGETEQSVRMYGEALRHSPGHPVALVNLGLGLEALGREAEAQGVYERAIRARPTEALAHFNLGNARFRRADFQGAAEAYRAAVGADPGLSRAHFYLAVSLVNTGRVIEALPALYTALEFAPGDKEILEVIRRVEAALPNRPGSG